MPNPSVPERSCPICTQPIRWCRTSKGVPLPLEPDPDPLDGYVYVEEGFAHEFEDNDHAMRRGRGGLDQAVIDHFDGQPPLYVVHFCPPAVPEAPEERAAWEAAHWHASFIGAVARVRELEAELEDVKNRYDDARHALDEVGDG